MSTKPRDDILAAIRRSGVFTYNQYSPSQKRNYNGAINYLTGVGMITVDKSKKARWLCTPGPNWQRRPKWEDADVRAEG